MKSKKRNKKTTKKKVKKSKFSKEYKKKTIKFKRLKGGTGDEITNINEIITILMESYDLNQLNDLNDFKCPITRELMKEPVVTHDGHTYERAAIEQWLASHNTSPLTGQPLEHKNLVPNRALKKIITQYSQLLMNMTSTAAALSEAMREELNKNIDDNNKLMKKIKQFYTSMKYKNTKWNELQQEKNVHSDNMAILPSIRVNAENARSKAQAAAKEAAAKEAVAAAAEAKAKEVVAEELKQGLTTNNSSDLEAEAERLESEKKAAAQAATAQAAAATEAENALTKVAAAIGQYRAKMDIYNEAVTSVITAWNDWANYSDEDVKPVQNL